MKLFTGLDDTSHFVDQFTNDPIFTPNQADQPVYTYDTLSSYKKQHYSAPLLFRVPFETTIAYNYLW